MTSAANPKSGGWKSILLRHETILLVVLLAEWFYFNSVGKNFATLDNTYDILRHSVEIGLLALAMTPIILTGGIDLSVGSLLGLCAILFGKFWRDAGLPIPVAAAATIFIGALAGGLNASLITWLIYGGYLHARLVHSWTPRRLALVSALGFAAVVFTYLGVNFLLRGLHSYS